MATTKTTRYEEQEPLTPEQLESFKTLLENKRLQIIRGEEEQMEAVRDGSAALRMSDEVDLASAEYDQAFEYRMRDREKSLLKKVLKGIQRIEEGTYDECETCGNNIGHKRLTARPEATLCIECKEEQERVEKSYKKARQTETQFPFK